MSKKQQPTPRKKLSREEETDVFNFMQERQFNLNRLSIDLKCKNESQKKLSNLIIKNDITICAGPAGTGKTFIACAQALKLLKSDSNFKKIILVKSVTVLEGEELGYLKGSLADKTEPVMISFIDNFHKLIGNENTSAMLREGLIEILPLTYIRGRSIDNSIIIVDEAQNISIKNMRSTLTRIGDNSKMIITGDTKQIDIKNKKLSSLDIVVSMFSEKSNIGTMSFNREDIVRNPIIIMIEDEFDKWEENVK